MRKLLAAALLAGGIAASAEADPRIVSRRYEPDRIVTLAGRAGVETTIALADDERIENIAVGNSAAWQVTPNKRANLLFVKPTAARAHTNMTVITDQHTYLFDLVSGSAAPVYMMRFSYPASAKPVVVPAAAVTVADAALAVAPPAAPDPSPADLNFDWHARGDKQLLPARFFDDNRSTFLRWSNDATLPAILVREANGTEGPANFTVKGDYIVVEGVPLELILRAGKQMAVLSAPPRAAASSVQTASAGQ